MSGWCGGWLLRRALRPEMSLIWKPLLRKGGLLLAAALVALALADHLGLLELAPATGGTPEGMAAGDDLGGGIAAAALARSAAAPAPPVLA